MREAVGLVEARLRCKPDVKIQKDVVGRPARADVVTADDFWYLAHDAADDGGVDDDAICEDVGGLSGDPVAGKRNEPGDDERGQRIEKRPPESHANEGRDDGNRREDIAL